MDTINILIIGTNSIVSKKIAFLLDKEKYHLFFKNHKYDYIEDTNKSQFDISAIHFDIVLYCATLKKGLDSEVFYANFYYPISLLEKINTDAKFINLDTSSYLYRENAYSYSKKIFKNWIEKNWDYSLSLRIEHLFGYCNFNNITSLFIKKMILNEDLELSSGKQIRNFIYIDDAIFALLCCINNINKIENCTTIDVVSDHSISIKELVLLLKDILQSQSELKFGVLKISENEFKNIKFTNQILKKFGWKESTTFLNGLKNEMKEVTNEIYKK